MAGLGDQAAHRQHRDLWIRGGPDRHRVQPRPRDTVSGVLIALRLHPPHEGAGAFGSGFGWKIVFTIYLWHVIYGVNFGKMYNPLPIDDPEFASEESVS
jgi:hypothetical protein